MFHHLRRKLGSEFIRAVRHRLPGDALKLTQRLRPARQADAYSDSGLRITGRFQFCGTEGDG